jgi:hypothetical protein
MPLTSGTKVGAYEVVSPLGAVRSACGRGARVERDALHGAGVGPRAV